MIRTYCCGENVKHDIREPKHTYASVAVLYISGRTPGLYPGVSKGSACELQQLAIHVLGVDPYRFWCTAKDWCLCLRCYLCWEQAVSALCPF